MLLTLACRHPAEEGRGLLCPVRATCATLAGPLDRGFSTAPLPSRSSACPLCPESCESPLACVTSTLL